MANNTLKFVVEVAADQATGALNAISTAVNQAGIKMKSTMLGVGESSRAAGEGSTSLEKSIKSLKTEMVQGDRTVNFFANSLNSFIPATSEAGRGIRLLADAFIGGVGLGFALQVGMEAIQVLGDHLKEAKQQAQEAARAIHDVAVAWDDLLLQRTGASQATALLIRQTKAIEQDKEVVRLTEQRADATQRLANAQDLLLQGAGTAAEVEGAQQELDDIESRLQARKNELFSTIASNARQALRDEQKEATNARQREAEEKTKKVNEEYDKQLKKEAEAQKSLNVSLAEAIDLRSKAFALDVYAEARKQNLDATFYAVTPPAVGPAPETLEQGAVRRTNERRVQEAQAAGKRVGDAYVTPMVSSFTQGLSQMLLDQRSFADVMQNIWRALVGAVINTIGQLVSEWATASITQSLVDSAKAASEITHAAGVAGANAAASTAAIPLIGPAAAVGAGEAMAGAVLSAMMPYALASARSGWDVPNLGGDIPAVLHKREMVLPEEHADTIRSLRGGGRAPTFNFYGHVIDRRGVSQFIGSDEYRSAERRWRRRQG